jgi:large subunit ribosomal protein L15e
VNKNYKQIAEERANKKYKNLEVLGSYFLAKDGIHVWHEIILIDKSHPQITKDSRYSWIAHPSQTGRVYRGKTSAAKKSRGLRVKGKGAEKMRPSKRANLNRRDKI